MNKIKLASIVLVILVFTLLSKSLISKASILFNQIEQVTVNLDEKKRLEEDIKKYKEIQSTTTFLEFKEQNNELILQIEELVKENKLIEKEIESVSKKIIEIKNSKWIGNANDVEVRGFINSGWWSGSVADIVINEDLNFNFTDSGLNVTFYSTAQKRDISIVAELQEIDEKLGLLKYRSVKANIHREDMIDNDYTEFYFTVDKEKMTCYIVNTGRPDKINTAFKLTKVS